MITGSKTGIVVVLSTVTSCVVLGLTASLTTVNSEFNPYPSGYFPVGGRSDEVVLLLASCISFVFGGTLIVTSFIEDTTFILKTKFFQVIQLVLFCMFLSSSIAVLANLDSIPNVPMLETLQELKDRAISSGVFGLVSAFLHIFAMQSHRIFANSGEETIHIVQ